ncbi:PilC/PilY family type IV pilus protein [Psychrobacter sp. APC 3281]|uniref:PilC/PilY family type IV pilus protein n=1 Tax=Psychrobacter sp. APC 3281 TaxID=3035190 RepID=UPI0025B3B2B9|nr:PilC/PilY family type IV pilus protein [Psychrobacter sp. APC 3281]MDN3447211.1 PilC/PilY family type IV pilus protein [Psychrobacter sp. APC 3281]
MKHPQDRQSGNRILRITTLSAAVLVGLTAISSLAYSATNGKEIGDLEIYQAAKGGKVTIMMMLDTSGSMDGDQYVSACDLPSGTASQGVDTENSSTNPSYKRKFCKTSSSSGSNKLYFFLYKGSAEKWSSCGPNGVTDIKKCNGSPISKPSDISEYNIESYTQGNNVDSYYYKPGSGGGKSYDRLTRLKDAIFTLMDSDQLDAEKVAIGIGQYSTQSNDKNVYTSPDGRSGKILVPAALLNEAQRKKIKEEVAKLKGTGNTPTANAYAEVGAYMLGTNTPSSNNDSGFKNSVSTSKKDINNYSSPLQSDSTCDGQGIYFLTDGAPNNGSNPLPLMKSALGSKGSLFSIPSTGTLPSGSNQGMNEVGEFAKALRSATLNPLGENKKILTAVVGFGSYFEVDRAADAALSENKKVIRSLSYLDSNGRQRTSDFYNCNNITNSNAKNACNWGAKSHEELPTSVGKFGEGGFYSASSTEDIIESITTFVNDLDQTLPSAPAGTITIPSDPYRASNQLPYAYLPMLAPDLSSNASIWKGNLKKYDLNQGTLFGNKGEKLYKNVAGDLSNTTQDIWQAADFYNSKGITANNDITAGGFYAQLRTPKSDRSNVRKVYVEDYENADVSPKKPILRELSVSTDGKPVGFNLLQDTETYTELNKRRLLSFLGFKQASYGSVQISLSADTEAKLDQLTLIKPTEDIRVLGGVVHSTPTAISYSATLDDNGRITASRDDYLLFGSMDGALHLADAKEGKEKVAIIPRLMLTKQPEALVENSMRNDNKTGNPYFGVDAPWLVVTDYKYDLDSTPKKVTVDQSAGKGMFAYGGLRMGGEAFYGIDISKVNNITGSAPKILFSITENGLSSATINKSTTNGFERLGQIWSKPTATKIRINKDDIDPTDVLIFGGGYDMAYEDDEYVAISSAPAKGNAIYIIDAKSGELIWSTTSSKATAGKNVKTDSMIHSITGEITVLDRDNDGLTDHIYAADLGGQVFRIDLQNARTDKFGFTEVANFSAKPPVLILNASAKVSEAKYAYRFYERPIVSFYRNEGLSDPKISVPNNGKLFALVNIASGNRSSPLSELRKDNKEANRVYGIIDNDVTKSDFYTTARTVENLTEDDLVNLAATLKNAPNEKLKNDTKSLMITDSKNGWFYPLIRFDGKNDINHNKSMGDSTVINSLLYTTVYNPTKQYGTTNSCSAKIVGGSERQVYCLPYGICSEDTSVNGTGGFIPAGQGIQELTLGAFNKDNTNLKVLIGTTTLEERIKAGNRLDYNGGGDGSASEYIFNERYTIQPRVWYERAQ